MTYLCRYTRQRCRHRRRAHTHTQATADTTIDMYEKFYEFEFAPTALRRTTFFFFSFVFFQSMSLSLLCDKWRRYSRKVYARAVSLKFALMQRNSMYAIDWCVRWFFSLSFSLSFVLRHFNFISRRLVCWIAKRNGEAGEPFEKSNSLKSLICAESVDDGATDFIFGLHGTWFLDGGQFAVENVAQCALLANGLMNMRKKIMVEATWPKMHSLQISFEYQSIHWQRHELIIIITHILEAFIAAYRGYCIFHFPSLTVSVRNRIFIQMKLVMNENVHRVRFDWEIISFPWTTYVSGPMKCVKQKKKKHSKYTKRRVISKRPTSHF